MKGANVSWREYPAGRLFGRFVKFDGDDAAIVVRFGREHTIAKRDLTFETQ